MEYTCRRCGAVLEGNGRFCAACGEPMVQGDYQAPDEYIEEPVQEPAYQGQSTGYGQAPPRPQQYGQEQWETQQQYTQAVSDEPREDSPYAVVSTGKFLGMMLLMYIPVVNLIMLIVWACGRKYNVRNFGRAGLLLMAISVVLTVLLVIAIAAIFGQAIMEGLDMLNYYL